MIAEKQAKIFEELRRVDPGIIEDGVPDEAAYTSAPYRILYLLKEVNGGSGWSLCEHLRNGGRPQEHDATWDNVARWTEGIFHLPEELAWSELEGDCRNRRKRMLPRIGAVNVKKTSGSPGERLLPLLCTAGCGARDPEHRNNQKLITAALLRGSFHAAGPFHILPPQNIQ